MSQQLQQLLLLRYMIAMGLGFRWCRLHAFSEWLSLDTLIYSPNVCHDEEVHVPFGFPAWRAPLVEQSVFLNSKCLFKKGLLVVCRMPHKRLLVLCCKDAVSYVSCSNVSAWDLNSSRIQSICQSSTSATWTVSALASYYMISQIDSNKNLQWFVFFT